MPQRTLPRVELLSAEPQLASLAVLETAANVAILALGAEYPELAADDVARRERDLPELRPVADVIELARAVNVTIARYRRELALRIERQRVDDVLF